MGLCFSRATSYPQKIDLNIVNHSWSVCVRTRTDLPPKYLTTFDCCYSNVKKCG